MTTFSVRTCDARARYVIKGIPEPEREKPAAHRSGGRASRTPVSTTQFGPPAGLAGKLGRAAPTPDHDGTYRRRTARPVPLCSAARGGGRFRSPRAGQHRRLRVYGGVDGY